MKKTLLTLAVMCAAVSVMEAKVTLPHIFGDNMVLQQQTDVRFWGTAEPSSKVTIRPSWDRKASVAVFADADGKWQASVSTPAAGGPYSVEISDGDRTVLENVLVGEVWFCSGQSNMEMPVKGFDCQPVEGSADVIMGAEPSVPIRFCTVSKATAVTPLEDCKTEWMVNIPEAVAGASATAYFFGQYLQKILDVPVGLVISDWGGTAIEAWMDRETIAGSFPEFDLSFIDRGEVQKNVSRTPTQLYNAMVAPLLPYTIKGFIWYQGETNIGRPEQYRRLMSAYAGMMRERWENPDMPFYFVQLAAFRKEAIIDVNAQWPYIREAQSAALSLAHTGMIVTTDIGDSKDIHPKNKQEVGRRLALLALKNDYGKSGIEASAPVYDSYCVEGNCIRIRFKNVGEGFLGKEELKGFSIAGTDHQFYSAQAKIEGDEIVISSPQVEAPAAVRYGWADYPICNLYGKNGLPVSPFRTDRW